MLARERFMPTPLTVLTDVNQSSYQQVGTTPISLSNSGDQLFLASGATISSAADAHGSSGYGISSGFAAGDLSLLLMGSVESASSAGIRMVSSNNKILIGSTGEVSGGTSGILLSDAMFGFGGNWVDNWGSVKGMGATGTGIGAGLSNNTITNMGTVEGFKGIVAGSDGSSNNKVFNVGNIFSTDVGVTVYGNGSSLTNTGLIKTSGFEAAVKLHANAGEIISIFNTGTIDGANFSIHAAGSGSVRITNQGTIVGLMTLGSGDDLYDGRGEASS